MFFVGIGAHLFPQNCHRNGRKSMYLPRDEKDNQSISIHNHQLRRHKVVAIITGKIMLEECCRQSCPQRWGGLEMCLRVGAIAVSNFSFDMVNLLSHGTFRNTEYMFQNMQF